MAVGSARRQGGALWRGGHCRTQLIASAILLLLTSGCGHSPSATIDWHPSPSTLSEGDGRQIRAALSHEAKGLERQLPPGTHLGVVQATASGSTAVLYASEVQNSDGSVVPTEGILILGTRSTGAEWTVVFPGDPGFCQALNSAPASVLDPVVKSHFVGC
ncbi:MAG: hypothetical protein QOE58_2182 [Actinomycetota bacterium]|jgi:hypothetical protein|nr:hypothetical protein [Actinomycetota bacterium]